MARGDRVLELRGLVPRIGEDHRERSAYGSGRRRKERLRPAGTGPFPRAALVRCPYLNLVGCPRHQAVDLDLPCGLPGVCHLCPVRRVDVRTIAVFVAGDGLRTSRRVPGHEYRVRTPLQDGGRRGRKRSRRRRGGVGRRRSRSRCGRGAGRSGRRGCWRQRRSGRQRRGRRRCGRRRRRRRRCEGRRWCRRRRRRNGWSGRGCRLASNTGTTVGSEQAPRRRTSTRRGTVQSRNRNTRHSIVGGWGGVSEQYNGGRSDTRPFRERPCFPYPVCEQPVPQGGSPAPPGVECCRMLPLRR